MVLRFFPDDLASPGKLMGQAVTDRVRKQVQASRPVRSWDTLVVFLQILSAPSSPRCALAAGCITGLPCSAAVGTVGPGFASLLVCLTHWWHFFLQLPSPDSRNLSLTSHCSRPGCGHVSSLIQASDN